MNQEYKEFSCIKNMAQTDKDRFDRIALDYANKLNSISSDNGSVYTLHDFDHHCCNLYKIISEVVLYDKLVFGQGNTTLSNKEIYLLNLSVLLHDIGMTKKVDWVRDNHSVVSAEMIQKDYSNAASVLSANRSGLSKNESHALALIVQAHSDVKDDSIPDCKNGLKNNLLKNDMPSSTSKKIRARFLANILRLADELDITSERLGAMDVEEELEEAIKKRELLKNECNICVDADKKKELERQLARYNAAAKSHQHWKKLSLFCDVTRDSSGKVSLVIDDIYINNQVEIGTSLEKLAQDIVDVKKKVDKEFQLFRKDVESELELSTMIGIKEIVVSTQMEELKKEIDRISTMVNNNKKKVEILEPQVISEELSQKISQYIDKRKLIKVGHYKLHGTMCSRDWIKVDEIIETESFFRKCMTQFLLHLQGKMLENAKYTIIGIDFAGMLISSRLAYTLEKPFSYVIPGHKKPNSSSREFNIDLGDSDSVVLVTDVVVTYETIVQIIKDYNLEGKVKAIYAVLYRGPEEETKIPLPAELVQCTYVLNKEYSIELRDNTKCKFKLDGKCLASNKVYD